MQRSFALMVSWLTMGILMGCTAPESRIETVERKTLQLGVPQDGFPNTEERTVLFFTNRMRSDPKTFDTKFGLRPDSTKAPVGPVALALDLNQAARWQARHLSEDGCPLCQDHSSCCPLGKVGGEVQCTGPVTGCGVTSWTTRIRLFSSRGGLAENATAGTRSAERAMWAWLGSGGHWNNLTKSGHRVLGPGAAPRHHVQVFGGGSEPRPIAAFGSRFQRRLQLSAYSWRFQDQDKPSFGQVYYKPGGGAPKIAMVVIEGVCHDLTLAYGKADHGSYEKEIGLVNGCHRYLFHFRDSAGMDHVYPSAGSLVAAVNDTTCADYDAVRPADSCSPSGSTTVPDQGTPPKDQGTPPPKDQGTPPPKDQGTPPPEDQGTPPPKDQGTPPPKDQGTPPPKDQAAPPPKDQGAPPPKDQAAPPREQSVASGDLDLRGRDGGATRPHVDGAVGAMMDGALEAKDASASRAAPGLSGGCTLSNPARGWSSGWLLMMCLLFGVRRRR